MSGCVPANILKLYSVAGYVFVRDVKWLKTFSAVIYLILVALIMPKSQESMGFFIYRKKTSQILSRISSA